MEDNHTDKKKILICYHSSNIGGVEVHILDLVKGLSKRADIYIACPNGELVSEYMRNGAKEHFDLYPRSEVDVDYVIKIKELIRSQGIDVIHAHELRTGFLAMLAGWLAKCPIRIYHVHTSFTEWQYGPIKKYPALIANTIANFIAGNFWATDVLALTKTVKKVRVSREFINERKITVIPNGINLEKYIVDSEGRKEIRNKYNIKDSEILVGNIARFTVEKGQIDIVRAAANISNPNIKFLLAGGGELLTEIQNQSNNLDLNDRVFFSGRFNDEDKIKYLSAFDIFVFPSRAEGFGIAAVEAMAVGLPIIASDLPVLKDVVAEAAVYYKPEDVETLSAKIVDLAINPDRTEKMCRASKNRAEIYSMEKFVSAYASLYKV